MEHYTYYTFKIYENKEKILACKIVDFIQKQIHEKNKNFFYPFKRDIKALLLVNRTFLKVFVNDENNLKTTDCLELDAGETFKWYNHDEEMKLLAKQFPTVIFKLHGDCEKPGISWDAYYKGNKSVKYCAEISPLNPKDLE